MEQVELEKKEKASLSDDTAARMKITDPEKVEEVQWEIDLIAWLQYAWSERFFFIKVGGVAVVMGILVAFSIPKEYTAVVKLVPESEEGTKGVSSLGGLAAMAGINLNATMGKDAISPSLYPDVVTSTPFLLGLFPIEVTDQKHLQTTSIYTYMEEYQREAWWSSIMGAPGRGIGLLKGFFLPKVKETSGVDLFHLNAKQWGILNELKKRIGVEMDKKTFTITLSARMQDPLVSAEVVRVVQEKLQDYITTYRTRKAKNDLVFTKKVFDEARLSYYQAQQTYAVFEDANRNIISSSYRTEQERLRNEMTLAFNVYNTLAQKLEQDKLRVQEQTPVYTVIEPAMVPLTASSPKKMLIVIGFILLSFVGGVGYLVVRNLFFKTSR